MTNFCKQAVKPPGFYPPPPEGGTPLYGLYMCSPKGYGYLWIDHFHKWWPIINSFASIKISLTELILKLIIHKKF